MDGLEIYPNPFNQSTTIKFSNPEGDSYELHVIDLSGKTHHTVNDIKSSEFIIEKGDLKEGFYFIELRGPGNYRGKIVIE